MISKVIISLRDCVSYDIIMSLMLLIVSVYMFVIVCVIIYVSLEVGLC